MRKRQNKISLIVLGLIIGFAFFWILKANVAAPNNTISTNKITNSNNQVQITTFNKNLFSTESSDSIWVVVNKQNPLNPIDYYPKDLVAVGNGQYLRQPAAQALTQMITAARTQGLILRPLSGFRSYQTQVSVYGSEVKKFGQTKADSESARPGYSEHQTGLAIDMGGGGCGIEDCFGNTKEGKWLAANAYKYGFIVRYTTMKQAITGYRAEPWHIRYIGTELSNEMLKEKITTLEEFFGLPSAPNY